MLRRLSLETRYERGSTRKDRQVLPHQQRGLVLQQFGRCIEVSEPQLLVDCLWRIGSLGFNVHVDGDLLNGRDSLVPRVLTRVRTVLKDSIDPQKIMDDISISKLFIGLARLQVSLAHFDTKEGGHEDAGSHTNEDDPFILLVEIFRTSLPTLGAQSLSNALWALSEMGVRRAHLSPALRREVLASVCALSPEFSDQALSMILWSLYKLGYSWKRLVSTHHHLNDLPTYLLISLFTYFMIVTIISNYIINVYYV